LVLLWLSLSLLITEYVTSIDLHLTMPSQSYIIVQWPFVLQDT